MNKYLPIILFFVLVIFTSCNKKRGKQTHINKFVAEWIDKQILIPTDISPFYADSTNKEIITNRQDVYKIVVYVDSFECTTCNLRLYLWKEFISETAECCADNVNYLFYFQPKSNNSDIVSLMKRDRFYYPVFFDEKNTIAKMNHWGNEVSSMCFLLDKNNRVLLVGDPTHNLRLWELYKKVVSG
ncbi:MAG: hypothetical protein LBR66_02200 [Candidatus Symbiothrix sp.]|jgi:hypothetical protein|nr:hypothetical protein [Candidatus Symbiothrix sp.]